MSILRHCDFPKWSQACLGAYVFGRLYLTDMTLHEKQQGGQLIELMRKYVKKIRKLYACVRVC